MVLLVPREIGSIIFLCGVLLFIYVLVYLRRGFLGKTEPELDHLVTEGPYRFCRHPQYLGFIVMVFGIDLMFRSIVGVIVTLILSIPSVIYRGKVEDRLLRKRFREEWGNYARNTGFFFPQLGRQGTKEG
jgi:protein-S-isoprenylcysteine O-methyltransferase Ste14